VRRIALISVMGMLLLFSGLLVKENPAQNLSDLSGEVVLTDQNTSPREFHRLLARMKQSRLNELRQLGKVFPIKETLAQSHYDAKYYRLDLTLNDTTEIISGSVYIYAQALIDGFNTVELNFFDNAQMYIDSIKSNDVTLSYSWSNDI
jgi:hypothetical protein